MKITHIYHSGFMVENDDFILIFDCINPLESFISKNQFESKDIYIFVSHGHGDHFNKSILNWHKKNKDIIYILSSDIMNKSNKENICITDPYGEIELDDITVQTYGSTDKGVSFLVKTDGYNIFHAGDLNWWHWKDNSKEKQDIEAEDFKKEVEKLKGEKIDIAFIPVDPRLEEYYYFAAEYFIQTIKPKYLIPMHFTKEFNITKKLKQKLSKYETKIITINKVNELILDI